MKKMICILLAMLLSVSCPAGGNARAEGKALSVVVTIFPIYDWVREVLGDCPSAEITMLMDSGVDLHSYQPTAQDILKISSADLFIYVGGESDSWVEGVLALTANPDLKAISLVEALGEDIRAEEIVEGMEHEDDHADGEGDHDEDHGEGHEHAEIDEHVWLSLRSAQKLVRVIADTLSAIDPAHAEAFLSSASAYIEKLAALDARYSETVAGAQIRTILFGDRFPFSYLANDYGLDYYAAFSGCSAESEASFQTILFLARKVDELDLPAVMTIEHPKTRIADTIVASTAARDQKILAMDSMQSITARDILSGVTYLSIMESNLDVLREALTR
ncbi:MAG: zinc ABC transporter substrate-binding protein [Clostridia bacterium]|nr:zinc ABC transporter substrate-binding protein [Clostridia bacterium]